MDRKPCKETRVTCPKCKGFLFQERDSVIGDLEYIGGIWSSVVRGDYVKCANCGYQSDKTMEANRGVKG